MLIALGLVLVLAPLAMRPDATRADGSSRIGATVRASPVAVRLFAPVDVVHGCGMIPVLVDVENLGAAPVVLLEEHLAFDDSGLRVIAHLGWPGQIVRPGGSRLALWLLSAREAGTYVLSASATVLFGGEVLSLQANSAVIRVTSDCRARHRDF